MEELDYPDLPFSGVILKAGAYHLGKYCEDKNDEFMQCRNELGMRRCIREGAEVTDCTLEFFSKLKKYCYNQLDRYVNCVEKSSPDLSFKPCRRTQRALDSCILDNLGIKRPELAYYARPRIYDSKRPAPVPKKQVFADTPTPPGGPDFPEWDTPKYGVRDAGLKS